MNDYEALRKLYPEYITLEDFYKICRIAKKSARYLVENNIVPAIDTGKKTWRYKINIEDVITYLYRRDTIGSMIPPGSVSSHGNARYKNSRIKRKSYSQFVKKGKEHKIAEYFEYIFADSNDVLTTKEVADMTGLDRTTITKYVRNGIIKAIESRPRILIPKLYLMEFVISRRFIESNSNSEQFLKILGGFEIWQLVK